MHVLNVSSAPSAALDDDALLFFSGTAKGVHPLSQPRETAPAFRYMYVCKAGLRFL